MHCSMPFYHHCIIQYRFLIYVELLHIQPLLIQTKNMPTRWQGKIKWVCALTNFFYIVWHPWLKKCPPEVYHFQFYHARKKNVVWFLLQVLWFCLHMQRILFGSWHSQQCKFPHVGLGLYHMGLKSRVPSMTWMPTWWNFSEVRLGTWCWGLGPAKS